MLDDDEEILVDFLCESVSSCSATNESDSMAKSRGTVEPTAEPSDNRFKWSARRRDGERASISD